MKRRRYLFALSCLLVGILGFGGVYTVETISSQRQEKSQKQQELLEQTAKQKELQTQNVAKETNSKEEQMPTDLADSNAKDVQNEASFTQIAPEEIADFDFGDENFDEEFAEVNEEVVETASLVSSRHFAEEVLPWPVLGNVLLPYSMDSTIYFPTLGQYRYHSAIVIGTMVNETVSIVADGVIKDVYTSEETGLTVVEDLGDGYEAIYGQLKDLNFETGNEVKQGQTLGYVGETTKYYAVEGSNLYFAMRKDGEAINPMAYLE